MGKIAFFIILLGSVANVICILHQCENLSRGHDCQRGVRNTLCCHRTQWDQVPSMAKNGSWINLDLSKNMIGKISDDEFLNCENLQVLDLSQNQIFTIERNAFRGLFKLEVLHLQDSDDCLDWQINNTNDLLALKSLDISLSVRSNRNFSMCHLTLLQNTVTQLRNLTDLHLSYYQPLVLPSFKNLRNLDELHVLTPIGLDQFHIQDTSFELEKNEGLLHFCFRVDTLDQFLEIWRNASLPFKKIIIEGELKRPGLQSSKRYEKLVQRNDSAYRSFNGISNFHEAESGFCYEQLTGLECNTQVAGGLAQLKTLMSTTFFPLLVKLNKGQSRFFLSMQLENCNSRSHLIDTDTYIFSLPKSFSQAANDSFKISNTDKSPTNKDAIKSYQQCAKEHLRTAPTEGEYLSVSSLAERTCSLWCDIHLTCKNISDCDNEDLLNFVFNERNGSITSYMRYLNLANTPFGSLTIRDQHLQSLIYLNLSRCSVDVINPNFLSFPKLEILDISSNPLKFCKEESKTFCINQNTWLHLRQLKELHFDNVFKRPNKEHNMWFLDTMTTIEKLSLKQNNLRHVPVNNLNSLHNLTHLDLSWNNITSLPVEIFDTLSNLATLDISYNLIESFTDDLISRLATWNTETAINIKHNRLKCHCVNLVQLKSMLNITAFIDIEDSTCILENGTMIAITKSHLMALEKECDAWKVRLIQGGRIVGIVIVVSLVIMIIALTFRKRWLIARKFLTWKDRKLIAVHENAAEENNDSEDAEHVTYYDAFVAHNCDADAEWVIDNLLPQLEDAKGMKMCISQRDFMGGWPIYENIANAVNSSRHSIIVLTPAFVTSLWCETELQLSLARGMHYPVIVVLDRAALNCPNISKTIKQVLKTSTYLEFPVDNQEAQEVFWHKLYKAVVQ